MPRGYLRRGEKKYCLSQKKARGGHSKKDPLYKKPPRWGPYWYEARKPKLRQRGHRERQWMIDDETSTALEYDYSNTDLGYDYDYDDCDYLKEDNLPPVVVSCEGDIDLGTAERFSVVERLQDPTPSECSYSLCGEDFSCQDVESFSILSVGAEDNDTVNSVASSLWEIVSEALPANDSNAAEGHKTIEENSEVGETCLVLNTSATDGFLVTKATVPVEVLAPRYCAICLEVKPDIIRLFHKCNHPHACRSCLRTHYITNNMKARDTSNFPLKCFWPGCEKRLRDAQVRRFVDNQNELHSFYILNTTAKQIRKDRMQARLDRIYRRTLQERRVMNFKTLQNCSVCETSNPVQPSIRTHFVCVKCKSREPIIVVTRKEVESIVEAVGDFLVNCPECERLICKEGGCDHMKCICDHEFLFSAAQNALRRYIKPSSSSHLAVIEEEEKLIE